LSTLRCSFSSSFSVTVRIGLPCRVAASQPLDDDGPIVQRATFRDTGEFLSDGIGSDDTDDDGRIRARKGFRRPIHVSAELEEKRGLDSRLGHFAGITRGREREPGKEEREHADPGGRDCPPAIRCAAMTLRS